MRTHVIIPEEIISSIDKLVGARNRSKFLVEAANKELKRLKLIKAFHKVAGSLKDVDIPGWETSESAARWVHDIRRMNPVKFSKKYPIKKT
ncbi:hypothetical protein HYS97_01015 [Candidatus Daviesbacteria bacterium]|nr:hypothetical protein [Candidatus Daviesbacteria bacterium]